MENLNYRFYILMVLGPMLAICSIRSLRYLSPCSVVANAVSLIYRIVASSSPSRIEAHAGLLRLLMKGIFDP